MENCWPTKQVFIFYESPKSSKNNTALIHTYKTGGATILYSLSLTNKEINEKPLGPVSKPLKYGAFLYMYNAISLCGNQTRTIFKLY